MSIPHHSRVIDLRGKVALVTGSARRVGRAIALGLAARGMNIVIHYGSASSTSDAKSAAGEARALGVEAHILQADLGDLAQIAALFEGVRARFGRLDVLVNSAATFFTKPIMDVTVDEWQHVLNINLTAPFVCSQHAVTLIRQTAGTGAIVNIADLSAFRTWKSYPAHSVSKVGIVKLTELFAASVGPEIRVNCVAPGPVLRDEGNSPEMWLKIGQRLPLQTTGDAYDVAEAVAFLASAPFVTGVTLRVDGGEGLI